jgi:Ni,Fe-hydrogenase I cytochrome b subunit
MLRFFQCKMVSDVKYFLRSHFSRKYFPPKTFWEVWCERIITNIYIYIYIVKKKKINKAQQPMLALHGLLWLIKYSKNSITNNSNISTIYIK